MATLDVLTQAEAFEALKGLQGGSDDVRVAALVSAISKRLDQACGPIVARTVNETFREGSGTLFLKGRPFAGTATVTEAWHNETPVAVAAADYLLEDDGVSGRLSRWAGYWGSRVTVSYSAGRFATTDAVEEPFTTAAGLLLQHFWRPAYGGGSETFGPPPGVLGTGIASFGFPDVVRDLLTGELLPPAVA